jgi:hypothetical protein
MIMSNIKLDVEVTVDLDPKGIRKMLWIGNTDSEQVNEVETWDEIIERTINYYVLFGGKIKERHRKEINTIRKGLKKALKKFDKHVDEIGYEK